MTKIEMEARIAELGGWNEINAIKVSWEKYQGFLRRNIKPNRNEITARTCGCCQWYLYKRRGKYDKNGCNDCVMMAYDLECGLEGQNMECVSEWHNLNDIVTDPDVRGNWRTAVRAIIKVLEKGLKERAKRKELNDEL